MYASTESRVIRWDNSYYCVMILIYRRETATDGYIIIQYTNTTTATVLLRTRCARVRTPTDPFERYPTYRFGLMDDEPKPFTDDCGAHTHIHCTLDEHNINNIILRVYTLRYVQVCVYILYTYYITYTYTYYIGI